MSLAIRNRLERAVAKRVTLGADQATSIDSGARCADEPSGRPEHQTGTSSLAAGGEACPLRPSSDIRTVDVVPAPTSAAHEIEAEWHAFTSE
jgi:hypothetical protein